MGLMASPSADQIRRLWYAPILAFAMGLMMVRLIVMARVLDVSAFSLFSKGVLVAGTFFMLGCLGLQALLQRELPVDILRGQERRGIVLGAQCNIVAVFCAFAAWLPACAGPSIAGMSPVLLAVSILNGLSQQLFLVATVESRSRGEVIRFALQNLVRAVTVLGAGTGVGLLTGSPIQVLAAEAVVSIVLSTKIFHDHARRASFRVEAAYVLAVRRMRHLPWRSALSLLAVSVVSFLLVNADRWVAAEFLGAAEFAQYSFAWVVPGIAQSVQAVINASVFPKLARRFAVAGRESAFRVALSVSVTVLVTCILTGVPAWLALDFGVRRWLPRYANASALLPLFLAIAALRVSDFWSGYVIIAGLETRLLVLNLAAAFVGSAIWVLWLHPWTEFALRPRDVALLGASIAAFGYGVTVLLAWRARKA